MIPGEDLSMCDVCGFPFDDCLCVWHQRVAAFMIITLNGR